MDHDVVRYEYIYLLLWTTMWSATNIYIFYYGPQCGPLRIYIYLLLWSTMWSATKLYISFFMDHDVVRYEKTKKYLEI